MEVKLTEQKEVNSMKIQIPQLDINACDLEDLDPHD